MQYTMLSRLKKAEKKEVIPIIKSIMLPEEKIVGVFKGMRNFVVFTAERIIEIRVHGSNLLKYDFVFVPYHQIGVYSLKNANTNISTIELGIKGAGSVLFEFACETTMVIEIINAIAKKIR